MAKRTKQTKKTVFEVGDLVLAKIKGYPHWPAQVTKVINSKTKPKYVVKFFRTEQIGTSFVDIKPYNASDPPPQTMRRDILEAYEECMKKYKECTKKYKDCMKKYKECTKKYKDCKKKHEKVSDTSPLRGSPKEGEETVDTSPPQDSPKKHEDTVDASPPQDSPKEHEETVDTSPPQDSPKEHEETEDTSPPQDSPKKHEEIMDASPPQDSQSEPVDCSLNDLTGEQANADRGIEIPSPKSEVIVPETNKTIEKLKKKLQEKLVEKEDKKKNLREKKEFEKASNILPKFIKKFQSLTAACENFSANPNDEIAERQVKVSIKTCESSLEQLNKCVIALSSEYGRKQKETEDFHNCLSKVVTCLKALKYSKNATQNSGHSRMFLKKMKKCKELLEFINSHGSANEMKEQLNAERKENARKRIKLSR